MVVVGLEVEQFLATRPRGSEETMASWQRWDRWRHIEEGDRAYQLGSTRRLQRRHLRRRLTRLQAMGKRNAIEPSRFMLDRPRLHLPQQVQHRLQPQH